MVSTDWVTLRSMTGYRLVRLAGKVEPDRWDELVSVFAAQGWKFGGELYDGDTILAKVEP
ncbi:hypothetical protein [Nocardia sp. NPDC059239]|uniref:hypothetical protein n=1 Tax=unclassified Nocardia TaxID=2637762 RepID=UPI0036D17CDD